MLQNLLKHKYDLIIDLARVGEDWEKKDFRGVGKAIGSALTAVILDEGKINIEKVLLGI